MITVVSILAFLTPIIVQMLILIACSPKVENRPIWKWGVIYSLGFVQSLVIEVMVVGLLFSITGMEYVSLLLMSILFLLVDFVNLQTLRERTMIVVPTDLKMVKGFKELLGMVNLRSVIALGVGTTLLLLGAVFMQLVGPSITVSGITRVIVGAVSIAFFAQFARINHPKSLAYKIFRFHWKDHPYHFNQVFGAQFNGFFLQFLVNIDLVVMTKPNNYSKAEMDRIYRKYQTIAEQLNQNRHEKDSEERLIVVLSESLSDPFDLEGVKTSEDVLANMHGLNAFHFHMASGYVGGGTANIEYEVYTGFSNALFSPAMATPYAHVIPSMKLVNSFVDDFKNKIGVHTFTGNLYQRDLVYEKLGFQKFYTTNSKLHPIKHRDKYEFGKYISDAAFFKELESVLADSEGNTVISGISMQNHMPFIEEAGNGLLLSSGKYDVYDKSYDSYLTGIKITDGNIAEFMNHLNQVSYPVTVLLYGDHTPNIFSSLDAEQHLPELRITPGIIWQNNMATGLQIEEMNELFEDRPISSNLLIPLLYEAKKWKLTPYYGLLTKILHELPAVVNEMSATSKFGLMESVNKLVNESELTSAQLDILTDYRLVQYDQVAGEQLLQRDFFV